MTRVKIAATLAIAFFQFQVFAKSDCSKESNYQIVTKAELEKIVKDKTAFIIDVNSDDSFRKTHVPGAVHFAQIEDNFANKLPTDKSAQIVAYCGGPMCGAWKQAAKKACEMGYTNIKHFKEGISGWNKKS